MSFEVCPNCGYTEPSRLKKVSQHMNLYAHIKDGKPGPVYGILNHHEDVVEIAPDIEGAKPFKVMKVLPSYTYKPPVEPKVNLPNKPVPTSVEKQTTMATPQESEWLKKG